MTAVRQLTAVFCCFAATALFAQTTRSTRKTTKTAAQPTTVTTAPTAEANAQTTTAPATPPVIAETDRDVNNPRAMRLSLDDAIKTAMERNVGIQVSRYDYRASGEALRSQYGLYDWIGTADLERGSQKAPALTAVQASSSTDAIANFGIQQTIPTGGTYNFGFNNIKSTASGGFTKFSPSYKSGLGFSLAQPVMRNFGVDVTQRGINIARDTLGINHDAFRQTLLDTTNSVEQAYLDLVYARQFVDVVKEASFLARDQARITQIRIDVGASDPLDFLQPRVQIATEEENLINAEAAVRNAEDNLRTLLHLDPADWDRPILPTDTVGYMPFSVNVQEAVNRAYDLRPELHELQLTMDTARIQNLYARNQTLPQVDLKLNYNMSGIAGRELQFDPITGLPTGNFISNTGYTNALSQVLGTNYPSWTFALNVGLPITNVGARAEAKRTELEMGRARSNEELTRQNIALQVRTAVRAIDTAAKNITAAKTARDAAEQNLEAERRRYENGMATNFEVLQIQQQLSSARATELQSLIGYNKALTAYHRAVGDLLDVHNVRVEDEQVQEPKVPHFFTSLQHYNWLNFDTTPAAK